MGLFESEKSEEQKKAEEYQNAIEIYGKGFETGDLLLYSIISYLYSIDKGIFLLPQNSEDSCFFDSLIGLLKIGLISPSGTDSSMPVSLTEKGIVWINSFRKAFSAHNYRSIINLMGKAHIDITALQGQDVSEQYAYLVSCYEGNGIIPRINELFLLMQAYKLMLTDCITKNSHGFFDDNQNGFCYAIYSMSCQLDISEDIAPLLDNVANHYKNKHFNKCVSSLKSWLSKNESLIIRYLPKKIIKNIKTSRKVKLEKNIAHRLDLRSGQLRTLIEALDEDRIAGKPVNAAAKRKELNIKRTLAQLRGDVHTLKISDEDKKAMLELLK